MLDQQLSEKSLRSRGVIHAPGLGAFKWTRNGRTFHSAPRAGLSRRSFVSLVSP